MIDEWIPGVLSAKQVRYLCDEGYIRGVSDCDKAIDHSSIDLTLDDEAYELTEGAVKPFGERFLTKIQQQELALPFHSQCDGIYKLDAKKTYLFHVAESLHYLDSKRIFGQATAKSSIGRVDVLARLVVDGAFNYEGFEPGDLSVGSGDMYLEITPLTFDVLVKPGISVSQLRLFRGRPDACRIDDQEAQHCFLIGDGAADGTLSADLTTTTIQDAEVVAFCASEEDTAAREPIPLWKTPSGKGPDPCRYWRFVEADGNRRLTLRHGSFYIIRSKERIALPKGVAVYCRAIDETFGEMRIHYAGFVHPNFGLNRQDGTRGTPLIFEVRGHDVNSSLQDGDKMARLTFYRMSEDADDRGSAYDDQSLQLSKLFAPWPNSISVAEDGTVTARE